MQADVSELEFGLVFDALEVGIVVLDRDGCIIGWNQWMARITGCSNQSAVGQNLFDIFPESRNSRLAAVIEDAFQAGSSSILTHSLNTLLPLRDPTGQQLLHNIIVRPVTLGKAVHCLLQINDVTVSVTRERVLRERQNARYHAIVDTAPDAIITTRLDGTIEWSNGAAGRAFGYSPSELLGRNINILLERDDSLSLIFTGGDTDSEDRPNFLQVIGRRRHGGTAHFGVSYGRWSADDRVFVTTMWRDISERIASDTALRESEERLRALLEAVPQLVWTAGPDGLFDYFNPQWQTYTGAPAEEHFGSGWLNAVHESDRGRVETEWKSTLARGDVFDVDARLGRSDASHRWFKLRAIPLRVPGETITRWLGTATDITDLVAAQNSLLRNTEELEVRVLERTREREEALGQLFESQKVEAIGRLTGGVAHDFNNLLAVILGSLTLLKKGLTVDPRTSRLLEGAIQGAERGATLTRRLLAFARRQDLRLEAVEIQQLIPEMVDFLRQSAGPNISIKIDIPADIHAVRIDSNQLELALMNLVVNARDAMPKGGSVTIACRNESGADARNRPIILPPGDYIRVSIVDTGEGMNETTLMKATEPFFTTKGIGKGTGLGLPMVQGLTAQAGGGMHISSRLGKGTVVTMWLPRARKEDVPQTPVYPMERSQEASGPSLRVLLVDDDILVSMSTADMLMDLGHSVSEATSGAEALQFLESDRHFDVVVTDYAMPGMSGLDLAMKIKTIRPGLPIILATGYAELPVHTTLEFPRLGKPYTQQGLAKALAIALKAREFEDHGQAFPDTIEQTS
jgi:PAS domain S-box-containing protein